MEKTVPLYDISYGNIIGRQGIRNGLVNASIHGPAVMKRPSVQAHTRPSTSAVLPSIYFGNDEVLYSVDANDDVWSGITDIGNAPNIDQDGHISWAESEQYILIHNSRFNVAATASDYVINRATPTVGEITDADHPINNSRGSSEGAVYLDGYWFIADGLAYAYGATVARSRIYNSSLGNPTAWTATNYIEAGGEGDAIVGIAKHRNHVVAFGTNTTQFFYNAGNPVGSPLAPRLDIIHYVGLAQKDISQNTKYGRIASYKDILFFEGVASGASPTFETRGLAGDIFMMDNFQVKSITTPEIKQMVSENYSYGGLSVLHYQSRGFLMVHLNSGASPGVSQAYNLVYDIALGIWYLWDTDVFNGSGRYYLDGDYSSGYIRTINGVTPGTADADGASTATYTWSVTTPPLNDMGFSKVETRGKLKTFNSLGVIGRNQVSGAGASISVAYTDDDYQSFSTARSISVEDGQARLHRLGASRQRAFRLTEATSDTDVEPHALVLDILPHNS